MDITFAHAADSRHSEDWIATSPEAVVLLDGLSTPRGSVHRLPARHALVCPAPRYAAAPAARDPPRPNPATPGRPSSSPASGRPKPTTPTANTGHATKPATTPPPPSVSARRTGPRADLVA